VDKSLLLVVARRGEARYRMLETIRQYGQETLQRAGEADLVRLRHRDWCVDLAERAEPGLLSARQGEWCARLDLEHDNLRAALRWARERGEAETVARIGVALWHFWLFRGYLGEGRIVLEGAVAMYAERTALRARVLLSASGLAFYQNDTAWATMILEEGLDLARALDDREALAYSLQALGDLRRSRGEYEQALPPLEESLALLRALGDTRTMAITLANCGLVLLALGEYERARALCEESLALARAHGSPLTVAASLTTLAIALLERGNAERARVLCEESLAIRQQLEDTGGSAHSLAILGSIALEQGQYPHALAHYQESLALRQQTGEQDGIAAALEGVAGVAAARGQARSAGRLFAAAEALRTAINVPPAPADRARRDRGIAAARTQVEAADFEEAGEQGRAMPLAEAIAAAEQLTLLPQATAASAQATTPSTGPQRAPSGQHDFGLTAREIEVLHLVTVGLTTRQIAERLIISPRTADAHLRSIYAKLGVTSRSAATRAAIEHKLA
jgi:ATP/maltotriose-dependent transcriptional regulator MalT